MIMKALDAIATHVLLKVNRVINFLVVFLSYVCWASFIKQSLNDIIDDQLKKAASGLPTKTIYVSDYFKLVVAARELREKIEEASRFSVADFNAVVAGQRAFIAQCEKVKGHGKVSGVSQKSGSESE